jgi:hypothetical protein
MDLPVKLVNVRRATWLLAAYNRRLMSILTLVNQAAVQAPKVGLKFLRWDPAHNRAIGNQTTSPFGRWGWDYLPLSYSIFRWTTKGEPAPDGPGSMFLGLGHWMDSAYGRTPDPAEPDPSTFGSAEDQRTIITVWLLAVTSGTTTDTWDAIRGVVKTAFEPHERTDGVVKDVPIGSLPGAGAGTVIRYVGWEVAVEEIASEQHVDTLILEPLRKNLIAIFQ